MIDQEVNIETWGAYNSNTWPPDSLRSVVSPLWTLEFFPRYCILKETSK